MLRQPLLHFALIGAALFLIYAIRNDGGGAAANRIVVDRGRIAWLAGTFATQFGHQPSRPELDSLVAAWVAEEMSYREALALGLEQDDSIVRRRLVQKYEFLNLDAEPETPDDVTLRRYWRRHRARYAAPSLTSFCQAYVVATPERASALARARAVGAALAQGADPASAGDSIDLPTCFRSAERSEVRRVFGGFFANTLDRLPLGEWVAPVESGYGFHAVRVSARRAPAQTFEERRAEIYADWRRDQARKLRQQRTAELRARYAVEIDEATLTAAAAH